MAKKTKQKSKKEAKIKTPKAAKIVKKASKIVAKKDEKSHKLAKNAKLVQKKGDKNLKLKPKISADKKIEIKQKDQKNSKKDISAVKSVPKNEAKADVKHQTKAAGKAPGKAISKSKLKAKKVEKKEDEFDDDLINDDFGESEIAEYEDDLKAVEEDDDDLPDELSDDDDLDEKETEVYLTDSEGRRLCRVRDCDQVAAVEGYCRYHYLLLWKKIQIRKVILVDGKLEKYIEDLTGRYPDKFLEMIRKDMKSEKDFMSAIQELEIDESALGDHDTTDDEAQSFADEIRGVADAPVIDDDGDF